MMISRDSSERLGAAVRWLALALITVGFAVPLIWMVVTSFKPEVQVMSDPTRLLPDPASRTIAYAADNYGAVLADEAIDFPLYLRNTLIIALLSVAGTVISSAVVAYGFARVRWRGRRTLFLVMLATMMIPFPVLMVPQYMIFREVGWIGSFKPLWVPAWFGSAFSIFLLRQFFMTIPGSLDDAARIDGCGHVRIFLHMIVPAARPALLVVGLLHFMFVWNDFLAPLVFLTHRDQFTLALGLQLYQSQQGATPWNLLMAASTMMIAPILLLFVLTQRTLVEGIATQGSKG